jgi:hypothetical protein
MNAPPPNFIDVNTLLETSQPRPRMAWFRFAVPAAILGVLAMAMFGQHSSDAQETVEALSSLCMILLLAGMSLANYFQGRAARIEQVRLEAAEELVQLRRWPQAALLLQGVLSRPTRTPLARLQALLCLCSVAARYHRFDDVSLITEHLLETLPLDASVAHVVKLSRAMALLRQDRLFDADRAIVDLRRWPQASESAGLALVEIYRDVKTGHAAEALELVARKRELIRRQLGHRLADALVLSAQAHDMLGHADSARADYESAALLAPAVELHRRYPETAELSVKYPAPAAPPEVAG